MILDHGICTVFAVKDISAPGEMPKRGYVLKGKAWYGVLDFSTVASWETQSREEVRVDERIRIWQDRTITNLDTVVLHDVDEVTQQMLDDGKVLEVVRAYHGTDETGNLITDLSLEVVGV